MQSRTKGILLSAVSVICGLGCRAQDTADPPIGADNPAALVVTTDFESGAYSVVDVQSRQVQRNIAAVHSDLACRFDETAGIPFIIERFGADAVDVIDAGGNWRIAKQYSVGAGSNPQDIAASAPGRAYVARLGDKALAVVNPENGAHLDTVDLSAYADADGIPEITRLHYRNGKIFALAARLDNFHPTDRSSMLVIDGPTGTVDEEIFLSFVNPSGPLRYSKAVERLVLIETGGFSSRDGADELDGIIEYFDPETGNLEGPVITSAALGGDIIDAIIVRKDKGYAVVERQNGADFETALLRFNPETGGGVATLAAAKNFSYPFMEVTPNGEELWLLDRTPQAPGIRIFDVRTDAELTETPIDVGLPPFMLCFVTPEAVVLEDAGDADGPDAADVPPDAGDQAAMPELIMEATPSTPLFDETACPLPRAPVLTVIRADETVRFVVDDEAAEIETGISLNVDASSPEKWMSSDQINFNSALAPYSVKVFARSVADNCPSDRVFSHIYNVWPTYPGAAGDANSTALSMEDVGFVGWATGYVEPVGYGEAVDEKWQTPEEALGPAEGTSYDIVCLGRGGEMVLTFDTGIQDDAGFDFAVFENSISDGFLDLAFVEVSTDGETFARFDTASRWNEPVGAFDLLNTEAVEGLAGKYAQGFGQPFDLHALSFAPEVLSKAVNLRDIRFVKFVDVVGDGTAKDSFGRPIFDPYPCSGSAGFDLEAVGVLHPAAR